MRDRLKYQEEQFNFMADALTERCWVCTKLCDDERGCIVAPEAYAGHDVLACSDNHFNRAYEMAMGIKPANRTFYDFARVAERRDEGRGKDYGFRIQEIIFEPNFPPYRRDELSKSLRAETFEADCRDCYGTGGLYDSRLGIEDECASCGGTGVMEAETFEEKIDIDDFNKVADAIQAVGQPATVLFETKFGTPKIVVVLGDDIYDDENVEIVFDILDDLKIPFNSSSVVGDTTTLERKEYDRLRKINGGHKDFLAESFEAPIMPFNKSGRPCPSCRSWSQSFIGGVCSRCANKDRKNAESVSDLELKKDSCCCGATKKTPCVCMILGRDCSAKKPMCACYRLKAIQQKDEKGAETFEARGRKRSGRKKKPKITGMFTRNTDITSRFNPDNPTQGWLKKSCLVVGCDNEVMVQNEMEGKRCLKCYDLMMNERGYYDSTGNGRYVEGEKRPQWMANLMKDSIEDEEDGTYSRYDKGYVAGLFLKSVKDARLNGILKQTNYQDSDLIGSDNRKELRISLNLYEPIALNDPLAEIFGVRIDDSGKYIIFNDTAYNVKIFKSMIGGLPPSHENKD